MLPHEEKSLIFFINGSVSKFMSYLHDQQRNNHEETCMF